jgi:hypothetical protein
MDFTTRKFRNTLIACGVLFCLLAYGVVSGIAKDRERKKFTTTYAENHGWVLLDEPVEQFRVWGPFEEVHRGESVYRLPVSKGGVREALWIRFTRLGKNIYLVDGSGLGTKLQ